MSENFPATMSLDAKRGDKVRYCFTTYGLEVDQKKAAGFLKPGYIYTVDHVDVHDSWSLVRLQEFPNVWFNTVLFAPHSENKETITGGVDIDKIVEQAIDEGQRCIIDNTGQSIARRAAELAVAKERERFKTLIQNTVNILNEDGKYAILCEKLSAAIRAGKEVGSE